MFLGVNKGGGGETFLSFIILIHVGILYRSHLIWIYTIFKGNVYPGSAGQGLRLSDQFSELTRIVIIAACIDYLLIIISNICH